MQSTLQCFGVSMVLLSLAPSALTFSRGASHVSCREMIPGHIRAQPQDLQRSQVTLRTSASSYLPGQLVTVTVRSSRDFMGFLLQARSVEGSGGRAGVGVGTGVGAKSMRVGPVLVGGSWTLTPPGTHTLRCLSEGDTLTHSDKQLKRNLSFVWRAPDAPMGDIRFYITVVQSYFVYWAGIESAVVRDGSRSPWIRSNITGVDGGNSIFTQKEDEVTALPAVRTNRPSNRKIKNKASPATTLGPPTPTSSGTPMPTSSGTPTPKNSGTPTPTPTSSGTPAPKSSGTPAPTSSGTPTPTSSGTPAPTSNGTPTPTSSGTSAPTRSGTPTPTSNGTPTPTPTSSGTPMPTISGTSAPISSRTPTPTGSGTPAPTSSGTPTPTSSRTSTPTPKSSGIPTPTPKSNGTPTPTSSGTSAPTSNGSPTPTSSGTSTPTRSGTPTPTSSGTPAPTPTSSGTPAPTSSGTPAPTSSGIPTPTSSGTPTPTPTSSVTPAPTSSGTPAPTSSGTPTPTSSGTPTPTSSGTPAPTSSGTPTPTSSGTPTPTPTSSGTQTYKSQETLTEVTRPVLEMNSSVTLASLVIDHVTNQAVNKSNRPTTSGSLQNGTKGSENDTYATSGSLSGVTEDTGSPHTEDPKSSHFSPNHLPFTASFSSTETREMETTTTLLPNITVQNSTSPFPLSSLPPLKDGDMKRKETNFQDSKLPTIPETKYTTLNPKTTTTAIPSTNHGFHSTNPPRPTSQNPRAPIQDQTSSVKFVTQSSFTQMRDETDRPFSKSQTPSPNPILPSKTHTLQSFLKSHTTAFLQTLPNKPMSSLPKPQPENSPSGPITRPRQTIPPHPQLQTTAPLSSPPQPERLSSFPQALLQTIPTQTQVSFFQTDRSKSDTPSEALGFDPQQTQSSVTPHMSFTSRFTLGEGKEVKDLPSQAKLKTMSPIFASIPSTTPSPSLSVSTRLSTPHSSSFSSTHTLLTSSLVHPTTPLYPSGGPSLGSIQTSFTHGSLSPSSSSMENQPKTSPALSALPSPSPISIPPHLPSVHPSSTSPLPSSLTSSTIPSLNSSSYPSPAPLLSSVPSSTSSSSPFTFSQSITGSIVSSSSIGSSTSYISSPSSSSSISTSISTSSSFSLGSSSFSNLSSSLVSSQSTTPHPGPSPAPRRSLYNPLTSTSSPGSGVDLRQPLTLGQRLLIQNHIASSDPEPNLNLPTPRTVVHPNPERQPNLDPNSKLNLGHELKPNLPKTDTKPKLPSNPAGTPDKEGKYPDIIPRHSAWELGMLLGCSAGLGMVLVVWVRYMYRQACGKRTEVTLNDREREYGRGERGLLHVQECGDLVRVRRIRENSFVLLAEYDILASPGD